MTATDDTSNASSIAARLRSNGSDGSISVGGLIAVIAVVFAVGGLALGLVPMVFGSYGEQQLDTPGSTDQDLSDEEETMQDAQFKNSVINLVTSLAPYLAVPLGIGLGFVAGVVHGGRANDLAVGIGVGTFVGVIAFVFLSSAIAMQQWWAVGDSFGSMQRWLQWDQTITNAALVAIPTALLAPVAGIAGSVLRG